MDTLDLTNSYVMPTYGRFPVALARGEGTRVWDESGRAYLDFCTGIAVCTLGHAHPGMRRILQDQAAQLWHCSNLYHIRPQAELARFLVERVVGLPGRVFFSNSGAEANDGLIKAARRYGVARPSSSGQPRSLVLTFDRSFHGRTLGGIAATGQAKVKEGFDPLLPGFRHLPFNDLGAVRQAVDEDPAVAVLAEPVQGEGGVHAMTPEFLRGLRAVCDERDMLLLLDEVQCGAGRTGDWCGWQSVLGAAAGDFRPDGMSWAKGMGGGFPIGAFWLGDRPAGEAGPLHGLLGPGSHGSTYGGSPLASRVALHVLEVVEKEGLVAHARTMGARLRDAVQAVGSPLVKEVRGHGLLLGVVLDEEAVAGADHLPDAATPALRVVLACLEAGLLVPPAGPDVVRLLPPLNVTAPEADEAVEILTTVLLGGSAQ